MSEHDKTGGPAFPTLTRILENYMDEGGYGRTREVGVHVGGMTLRDYFAAKAMPAVYADWLKEVRGGAPVSEDWRDGIAMDSYLMSDAMLKAREA